MVWVWVWVWVGSLGTGMWGSLLFCTLEAFFWGEGTMVGGKREVEKEMAGEG